MNRLQKAAVITRLLDELHQQGSWCGETHVQKSVYFLQTLLNVPTDYEFILYKHGPFSFELKDAMSDFRADGLIDLIAQPYPYGPSYAATQAGEKFVKRYPKTLSLHNKRIASAAKIAGKKGVKELEQLATALWVTREAGLKVGPKKRAKDLHDLKPHVSLQEALAAITSIDALQKQFTVS